MNKADFLKCLEIVCEPLFEAPNVSAKIIDGAAFVNMNAPKQSKTYGEYCQKEIQQKIKAIGHNISRLDLVFDIYKPDSIKGQMREFRGKGIRVSVRVETPIYKSFPHFMRHDDNKSELFGMIADATIKNETPGTTIAATKLEKIVSNHDINRSKLEPCDHEEADTRVMLHAVDISSARFNKLN